MSETVNTKIWNPTRILYGYLYDSDEDGCLPNIDDWQNSSKKIGVQRLYAAMRAYGKKPEWFYRSNNPLSYYNDNRDKCLHLLSETRSKEKMMKFRDLVKRNLRHDQGFNNRVQSVDSQNFMSHKMEVSFVFSKLMEYRKKLFAIEDIWSSMLECSRSIGAIFEMTTNLTHELLCPMSKIIDEMILLLMGDDYDKTFTEEELFQYGFPNVTDEELFQMQMDEF